MKTVLFVFALLLTMSVLAQTENQNPEENQTSEKKPTPVELCMEACWTTFETPSYELKACVSQCQGHKVK